MQPEFDFPSSASRRSFLQRSAAAATVAVPAALAASTAGAQEAARRGPNYLPSLYPGWNAREFSSIRQHERDHVNALISVLTTYGRQPIAKPAFKNLVRSNALDFAGYARFFENLDVAAYLGAAPLIQNSLILAFAGSIATVEGRQAGYLNVLLNASMTFGLDPNAADPSTDMPLSPTQVAAIAGNFIVDPGPVINLANNIDDDLDVLNFALALEYLGREFYDINVPRFFGV